MTKPSSLAVTSYLFGILCILYCAALVVLRYSPARVSFVGYIPPASKQTATLFPTRVSIPQSGVDVAVYEAQLSKGWELNSQGASHLSNSPTPGDVGNSIIYGHNWTHIFGNLVKVRPGQHVSVTLNNGAVHVFEVTAVDIVPSNAVEVLQKTSDIHLTLFTCTGLFDQQRFVVSATRI